MTKDHELAALRDLGARLGRDSYLGPMIERLLPLIERDIRADLPPIQELDTQLSERRAELAQLERVRTNLVHQIAALRDDTAHLTTANERLRLQVRDAVAGIRRVLAALPSGV